MSFGKIKSKQFLFIIKNWPTNSTKSKREFVEINPIIHRKFTKPIGMGK